MIGVDVDFRAEQHGTKLFEGFNNGEQFFFDGGVVSLSRIKLARVECDRLIVLFDDGAKLEIRCVGLEMKRFVVVGIDEHRISLDESLHGFESFMMVWLPLKRLGSLEHVSERSEDVGTTGPHVSIVGNKTKKGTKLLDVVRGLHVQNGFDFLWVWFDTLGC